MDRRMDRRTVAKGAGAVAGVAALGLFPASAEASGAPQTTPAEPSLYDRLGGYFAIAAVVDRFSDKIIRNPILNKNPALKEWNRTQAKARLPGLKFGRTLWIAAAAGGPFVYTGLPLSEAHAEFNLTAERVRRSWGGDRPRPRLLRGAGTRAAGTGGRLPEPACPTS